MLNHGETRGQLTKSLGADPKPYDASLPDVDRPTVSSARPNGNVSIENGATKVCSTHISPCHKASFLHSAWNFSLLLGTT